MFGVEITKAETKMTGLPVNKLTMNLQTGPTSMKQAVTHKSQIKPGDPMTKYYRLLMTKIS